MKKIPVTIITGFLGAGKTTFLNRLIRTFPEKKFAIIENEFGETMIDSELVVGVDDGIYELANGCVCCTLNKALAEVLHKLISAPGRKPDHILLETTGIADPGSVALSFLADSEIAAYFEVDGIVTLADCRYIEQQLEREAVAVRQVALADMVVLTKTDLADPYIVEAARNIMKRMNPAARQWNADLTTIPDADILHSRSFSAQKALSEGGFSGSRPEGFRLAPESGRRSEISKFASGSLHASVSSLSFEFSEPLDPIRFTIFLRFLLNENDMEIFRIKGILYFWSTEHKVILQGVNKEFLTESGGEWLEGEERRSRLVVIGNRLSEAMIEKGLACCRTREAFDPAKFYEELKAIGEERVGE